MEYNKYVWLSRRKGGSALRTPTVEGYTAAYPEVGKTFSLIGKPLNAAASARLVETSVVTEVKEIEGRWGEPIYDFTTASGSEYRVAMRPPPEVARGSSQN